MFFYFKLSQNCCKQNDLSVTYLVYYLNNQTKLLNFIQKYEG